MAMTPPVSDAFPSPLTFEQDTTSRRKKGVHRPVYAPVFTEAETEGDRPAKVYLLVNPYSGKRKGRAIAEMVK